MENLGATNPSEIVEVIQAGSAFLDSLKLGNSFKVCQFLDSLHSTHAPSDTSDQLELNSLGDIESRDRYKKALREYLHYQKALLSSDSLQRYTLHTSFAAALDSAQIRARKRTSHSGFKRRL